LVLLLTLLGIIISWRDAAAESYLKAHPTGRLARLVHRSRDRWYGILITPACLVWTAGRALVFFTRDLALGFERTRKALAFVFRRRIERQAEIRGFADGEIDELPDTIVAAFTEEPVSDGPLVVDFFPGLDELQSSLASWFDRRVGGSVLLAGERGSGKTSWLHQVDPGELPKTLITLDHRPSSDDELARLLSDHIAPGAESRFSLDQ
jgi:hypothetical protein